MSVRTDCTGRGKSRGTCLRAFLSLHPWPQPRRSSRPPMPAARRARSRAERRDGWTGEPRQRQGQRRQQRQQQPQQGREQPWRWVDKQQQERNCEETIRWTQGEPAGVWSEARLRRSFRFVPGARRGAWSAAPSACVPSLSCVRVVCCRSLLCCSPDLQLASRSDAAETETNSALTLIAPRCTSPLHRITAPLPPLRHVGTQ